MPNIISRPVSRLIETSPVRGLLTAIFLGYTLFSAAQNPVKDSILRIINDPAANDSLRARAMFGICTYLPPDSVIFYENELKKFAAKRDYKPAIALSDRLRGHRYYKTNVLDSSEFYFKKSLALAEKLEMHETIGKVNYNCIFLYYKTGEDIKGVAAAQRAIRAFEITGDSLSLGNTYQQMGQCYQHLSQPAKSLEALQKALTIGEKIDNATLLGNVYGTLGNLYYRQGDALKGIEYCKKGIELAEKTGFTYGIASGYGNLAGMYDFLKMEAEADTADMRSLRAYEKLGDLNNIGIAKINMGYKLSKNGAHAKGLAMVKEGHELLKSKGNLWPLNVSMKMMGSVYAHQKKYDLAKKWCLEALLNSEELGLIKLQFDNAKCVYEACEAMGDYKQALLYYQKYKRLEDSIYSEDNAREMAAQETKYVYEKQILADSLRNAKEKEVSEAMIVAQEAKIKQSRVTLMALIGGLLLAVLFAVAIYNRFQVTRRQRDLISRQKEEVETKNAEILQSIAYARRLQDAVLPPARVVKEFFADSYLLYLPKDIVSGDFYWMENRGSVSYFAVGDCTGHGVPGAMLSVIGLNGLNRCLNEMHITAPSAILEQLTLIFQSSFERSEATVRDGMDIGICALDNATGQLTFAGANNMLRIIRTGEVLEFKGDKRAVGFHDATVQFSEVVIPLQKDDILLLSTDGIVDQFGGPEGKKFLNKRLREALIRLSDRPMAAQRNAMLEEFEAWRGSQEQTDDVCVMGVRV